MIIMASSIAFGVGKISKLRLSLSVIALLFAVGCSANQNSGLQFAGGSSSGSSEVDIPPAPTPQDVIVIDELEVFKDGSWKSWKLDRGNYFLELTASNDGVTIDWIGGMCGKTAPVNRTSTVCLMPDGGQIVVENPTTFGLGKSVSVTLRLTKLADNGPSDVTTPYYR